MQLSPPAGNEAEQVIEVRMERNFALGIAAQYSPQYLGGVGGRSPACRFVEVDTAQHFAGC
jgi:hypothetical protein